MLVLLKESHHIIRIMILRKENIKKLIERMEIIILDINKRKEIKKEIAIRREKIEKRKLLECANLIDTGSDIEIIEPIEKYDKKLMEMYKISYPIYQTIDYEELDIQKLSKSICFENEDIIILPYFNNTKHWIKIRIGDKEKFFKYMFLNGYFNSFSLFYWSCLPRLRILIDYFS